MFKTLVPEGEKLSVPDEALKWGLSSTSRTLTEPKRLGCPTSI